MKSHPTQFKSRLELTYCYGGTVQHEPGEVLGPRILTDYEAVLVIEGFPLYQTDHASTILEPGSILIAQPGTRETYIWDQQRMTRHAYIHFNLDVIPPDWPPPDEWPRLVVSPPPILGQLFRHLTERAFSHPEWPAQKPDPRQNHLFETFLELYLHTHQNDPTASYRILSEPVQRAAQFMRERLDSVRFEPFSLNELAACGHVTPKHLCRAFTNELGISPMKACRLMQFQLAIPLLARSNMNIKQIAERCGFQDQLYFSRTFSRTFGQSPSQVRKAILSGRTPPTVPLPPALMPRMYW